eukprot:1478189-Rhodomonas_salina.1
MNWSPQPEDDFSGDALRFAVAGWPTHRRPSNTCSAGITRAGSQPRGALPCGAPMGCDPRGALPCGVPSRPSGCLCLALHPFANASCSADARVFFARPAEPSFLVDLFLGSDAPTHAAQPNSNSLHCMRVDTLRPGPIVTFNRPGHCLGVGLARQINFRDQPLSKSARATDHLLLHGRNLTAIRQYTASEPDAMEPDSNETVLCCDEGVSLGHLSLPKDAVSVPVSGSVCVAVAAVAAVS